MGKMSASERRKNKAKRRLQPLNPGAVPCSIAPSLPRGQQAVTEMLYSQDDSILHSGDAR